MKKTLIAVGVILISVYASSVAGQNATASGAVANLVSFNGVLQDSVGKEITEATNVTFVLYKNQHGGSPLWLETQSVTPDSTGRYNVKLGAATAQGVPPELFMSGDAQWLGVQIANDPEQPRVLLVPVPYARKAGDADTVGGLPASAFVLAEPTQGSGVTPATETTSTSSSQITPAITGTGTTDFLPLWTSATALGSSVLFQSGSGSAAKVGIGTTTPATTLDVKGAETVRGTLTLPATGAATSSKGFNSQSLNLAASSYSATSKTAGNYLFDWTAEPVGNNTSAPGATLNLLYAAGSGTAQQTGLQIASNGQITFASAQTFPGAGSVTSVGLSAPSSDFTVTGSPVTKSGTLALNWNLAPTSAATANTIVKRDSNGSFSAGAITSSGLYSSIGSGNAVTGAVSSGIGVYGQSNGTGTGNNGVQGDSSAQAGSGVVGLNSNGGIGVYGSGGTGIVGTGSTGVFGTGSSYGFDTDSNVHQARTAGGWAKAMVYVNGLHAPYTILGCFNSALAGAAATTPPCGFNLIENAQGDFTIDFGFQVDDRFFSITPGAFESSDLVLHVYPSGTTAQVVGWAGDSTEGSYFYVLVF